MRRIPHPPIGRASLRNRVSILTVENLDDRANRRGLSMSSFIQHGSLLVVAILSSAILGGGVYECLVIDPCWPKRPDLIQPAQGGISRGRFWLPFHITFEIALIFCLIQAWNSPNVRVWLLLALASHAAARTWSAFDFIPKALAFERA